jgi:hypothetical protein
MKYITQINKNSFYINYANTVHKPYLNILRFIVIISFFILLALITYMATHTLSIMTIGPTIVFSILFFIGGYIFLVFSKNKLCFQKLNGEFLIEAKPFKALRKRKIQIKEIKSFDTTQIQHTHNSPHFHQTKDIVERKLIAILKDQRYIEILQTCNFTLLEELQNNLNKILKNQN